jgi:hypothetical protein
MAEMEINPQASRLVVPEMTYDQRPTIEDKHATGQYSPIAGLPTELLLQIFHYDDPGVTKRLILTQVCRHWRAVTIQSAPLWTSITIKAVLDAGGERFRKFISLLKLQFERTQDFPLDVLWYMYGHAERIIVILDLIRRKGPFHRWRSLTLVMAPAYQICPSPRDRFSNLESLLLVTTCDHPILRSINLTTTSKLRKLDISRSGTREENIGDLYGTMLTRITSLVLPKIDYGRTVGLTFIPANITTIEGERRSKHPFPHVRTYKLTYAIFLPDDTVDLQRLTTLTVTNTVVVLGDFRLVLPSLRRLVCANITLGETSVFDAPLLEVLEFCKINFLTPESERDLFSSLTATLGHPGYLLSPTKSLSLVLWLPADLVTLIITRHSCVERLTLRVDNGDTVWGVTGAIMGDVTETGVICPHLTELRLVLSREYRNHHDVEWWKDRAAQIVRGRSGHALRIYGSWDNGETFRLLA